MDGRIEGKTDVDYVVLKFNIYQRYAMLSLVRGKLTILPIGRCDPTR